MNFDTVDEIIKKGVRDESKNEREMWKLYRSERVSVSTNQSKIKLLLSVAYQNLSLTQKYVRSIKQGPNNVTNINCTLTKNYYAY